MHWGSYSSERKHSQCLGSWEVLGEDWVPQAIFTWALSPALWRIGGKVGPSEALLMQPSLLLYTRPEDILCRHPCAQFPLLLERVIRSYPFCWWANTHTKLLSPEEAELGFQPWSPWFCNLKTFLPVVPHCDPALFVWVRVSVLFFHQAYSVCPLSVSSTLSSPLPHPALFTHLELPSPTPTTAALEQEALGTSPCYAARP